MSLSAAVKAALQTLKPSVRHKGHLPTRIIADTGTFLIAVPNFHNTIAKNMRVTDLSALIVVGADKGEEQLINEGRCLTHNEHDYNDNHDQGQVLFTPLDRSICHRRFPIGAPLTLTLYLQRISRYWGRFEGQMRFNCLTFIGHGRHHVTIRSICHGRFPIGAKLVLTL